MGALYSGVVFEDKKIFELLLGFHKWREQNTPSIKVSITRIAIRNSLILNLTLWIPEKIQTGAIKVVRRINKIEIPSMPNLKLINPSIQFFSSTNWKFAVVVSKENQRKMESNKFANDEKIAIYLEFFSTIFWFPLVAKIKKAPIKGINIIDESIGKFI